MHCCHLSSAVTMSSCVEKLEIIRIIFLFYVCLSLLSVTVLTRVGLGTYNNTTVTRRPAARNHGKRRNLQKGEQNILIQSKKCHQKLLSLHCTINVIIGICGRNFWPKKYFFKVDLEREHK